MTFNHILEQFLPSLIPNMKCPPEYVPNHVSEASSIVESYGRYGSSLIGLL